jgi:DNA polymerase elongation subunit (family B)
MRGVKIHDIETYINLFVYCDVDRDTGEEKVFIVWKHINQLPELVEYLSEGHKLVGFNNISFDGPVLTHIVNNISTWIWKQYTSEQMIREIYRFAQVVIRDTSRGGYPPISEWELSNVQLDLFKMWHYDNPARFTRLKDLQISMNWGKVVDTPIHHTTEIERWEDVEVIVEYCKNDIRSTKRFYELSRELIDMRIQLSQIYGLNLMNANDPKIGSEIFAKLLSERMGLPMRDLKKMRTFRERIDIGSIILDYIKFDHPSLVGLLDVFKKTTITQTKGGFKQQVKLKGFGFDLGLGGIHGCVKPGVYTEDEIWGILDIDVVSFYPNLAIENGFYPEHLGQYFCDIFKMLFYERRQIPKEDPRNYAYKIMLNGVYGKSNDKDSYLYDPKFTMQITINGQLLILMLAERLMGQDIQILQANTDGITIRYRRKDRAVIDNICEDWCNLTKLNLEYAEYSKMVIKDVNNYIGITSTKAKYKGSFELLDIKEKGFKDWHKDPSFRIVARAVSEYFIKGIDVEQTVKSCMDIHQFVGRAKFKSDSTGETRSVVGDKIVVGKQQKTTRYIIARGGCQFMKVYSDGRESIINKGYLVNICNDLSIDNKFDINYKFYIREAQKIIEVIEGDKNQLNLF